MSYLQIIFMSLEKLMRENQIGNKQLRHYARSVTGVVTLIAIYVILVLVWDSSVASSDNGFDLSGALIPENEIMHGGPPRDGIPAIHNPKFLPATEVKFLNPKDRVLGVFHNGVAKAYPVLILNYHEIVNDNFSGDAVVVSFCPLCGTGMVFKATVKGVDRKFGVSGLLYNSDMLLYDLESESLWSQIMMQSVAGPLKGALLEPMLVANTSWQDWKNRYPTTKVLSRDTGFNRDYNRSPYPGYSQSETVMFPVSSFVAKYHPKEKVIGLQVGNSYKAYPFSELAKADKQVIRENFAGKKFTVKFDSKNRTGAIYNEKGVEIPSLISYWFAWIAFHPESVVFTVEK